MTRDEIKKWMLESSGFPVTQANVEYLERFQAIACKAGAASRDAYIEQLELALLQVRKAICGDIHNTDDLLDLIASRDAEVARLKTVPMRYRRMAFNAQLQDEIEELVAALKPFGAIDLVESRLPAEFAMLILRARAAIAQVRKP